MEISIVEKLKNFPPINFISIRESVDRRNILYEKFDNNGIYNSTPHVYKKYEDGDCVFSGKYFKDLDFRGRGPVTSHLKAIKEWYFDTDEEYAFFCEDDISFETVKYWNFTWEEFFNKLPNDWSCIQLCWVRENIYFFSGNGISVRERCWCDWSACAYLIKRSHAKKLISNYYRDGEFILDYAGDDFSSRKRWALIPTAETIIYSKFDKIYGFPLFVEDVNNCGSTYSENGMTVGKYNLSSYSTVVEWWETIGKNLGIDEIFKNELS